MEDCDLNAITCGTEKNACVAVSDVELDGYKIQGNFLPYMKAKYNIEITSLVIEDRYFFKSKDMIQFFTDNPKDNEIIDFNKKGKCLKYSESVEGSIKKGFILEEIGKKNPKSYVVMNLNTEFENEEMYLKLYTKEVMYQQYLNYKLESKLVPKIISMNIFYSYIPDYPEPTSADQCGFSKRPVVQKLEENATNGDFEFLEGENGSMICFRHSMFFSSINKLINDDKLELNTDNIQTYNFFKLYLGYNLNITEEKEKDLHIYNILNGLDLDQTLDKIENKDIPDIKIISKFIKYSTLLIPDNIQIILKTWFNDSVFNNFITSFFKDLWEIHRLNLFHGDLKEDNILFKYNNESDDFNFKFIDFGFARTVQDWMKTYEEQILPNIKSNEDIYSLYISTYAYFKKHNYTGYKKNTSINNFELVCNLMMCELLGFERLGRNTVYTLTFLPNIFFSVIGKRNLFGNPFVTYRNIVQNDSEYEQTMKLFITGIYNKIIEYVAFRYADCISNIL